MDSIDNQSSSSQVSKELKISQSHLLEIADVNKPILPLCQSHKRMAHTTGQHFIVITYWFVYLLY